MIMIAGTQAASERQMTDKIMMIDLIDFWRERAGTPSTAKLMTDSHMAVKLVTGSHMAIMV